jgi:outer membrane protein TolC
METIKSPRLTLLLAASLGLASGCAQIPRLDPPPAMKKVDELGSTTSFAVPVAAWPHDQWWNVYGDPQLNALIDEALKNAPDLDLAQARLKAAAAQVQGAGATRLPEVSASAVLAEAKQSYDFWGKNRAALAAAVSEQHAAEVEIAQTRLILSTSIASAYAGLLHLYTLRDNAADTLSLREQTVALFGQRHRYGLETLASVRQVEARQAGAKGDLLAIDERIGL